MMYSTLSHDAENRFYCIRWTKCMEKKQDQDFDVAMGSYDGAEVCEFVEL